MSILSNFAKEIIRECAEQPKTSVYSVYAEVMHYCPKSSYTIEQVGKYLRYVKRAIIRKQTVVPPLAPPTTNLPYVPTYLPPTSSKQKMILILIPCLPSSLVELWRSANCLSMNTFTSSALITVSILQPLDCRLIWVLGRLLLVCFLLLRVCTLWGILMTRFMSFTETSIA